MAQMQMGSSVDRNLEKTIHYMEQAAKAGADLIFFPEVQLTPFFPQYEKRDAEPWAMREDGGIMGISQMVHIAQARYGSDGQRPARERLKSHSRIRRNHCASNQPV